ncbi:MAG: AmmeMemoRadiSam system protein B [Gammaproteobacteria bacterium]|nr:AmmeMemoRadiSam system protein B [Gammaproteobacteria bacterium]
MERTREPAVAGYFYPADPQQLRGAVKAYLEAAKSEMINVPKALIAPHAGYVYSGPVAAHAYAQLQNSAAKISRVLILAPAHRLAFDGIAYSSDSGFRTPLGTVPVDTHELNRIAALPQLTRLDAAFDNEHSIEVQLPFLQVALNRFQIIPLLVGRATPSQVQEILEALWGGDETLIVISSDLSHYLSYSDAKKLDLATTYAIEALDPDGVGYHHACGRTPVNGLLLAARRHRLTATTLNLRNSGDTAGPKDRVVGYGAYGFH